MALDITAKLRERELQREREREIKIERERERDSGRDPHCDIKSKQNTEFSKFNNGIRVTISLSPYYYLINPYFFSFPVFKTHNCDD